MTHWIRPTDLASALTARKEHPDYVLLAGGTDLMVGALDRPAPVGVIDLFGLDGLLGVTRQDDGGLRVGAATTYRQLLDTPHVIHELPALWAACREIGALQIQARGTLGGNLATSSPVGDTLPVLLALDAEIELASVTGTRRLPYEDFCTGYRTTALAANELIVAMHFPADVRHCRQTWRKVGTRRAQSISKVMFAASVRLDDTGKLRHVRIALGAVRERPVRARSVETLLAGMRPDLILADRAAQAVAADIAPIDDVRSRADYRAMVSARLVRRFVRQLAGAV